MKVILNCQLLDFLQPEDFATLSSSSLKKFFDIYFEALWEEENAFKGFLDITPTDMYYEFKERMGSLNKPRFEKYSSRFEELSLRRAN